MKGTSDFADWRLVGAIPGNAWPAVPPPNAAATLAVVSQLNATQWLEPEAILTNQVRQLASLLRHTYATVPWYQKRWRGLYDPSAPLSYARIAALPRLTRDQAQSNPTELRSVRIPNGHGKLHEGQTSGSTGTPLRSIGPRV